MSGDIGPGDLISAIEWCKQQADEIMSITAGCATTHGDPGGGLEWANRLASDIAINLEMALTATFPCVAKEGGDTSPVVALNPSDDRSL